MLALVGRRFPQSLRAFILTIAVADDLASFVVIATAYTSSVNVAALMVGLAVLAIVLVVRLRRVRNGVVYLTLGLVAWVALRIAQRMRAIVGAKVKVLLAAFGNLQAEAGGCKTFRRFKIGRTEPDVAHILQLDHLGLLFLG